MIAKIHLGNNIAYLRRDQNIKQETLGNKLGISQQAVSQMERREFISDELLEKVAIALNTTPLNIRLSIKNPSGLIESLNKISNDELKEIISHLVIIIEKLAS